MEKEEVKVDSADIGDSGSDSESSIEYATDNEESEEDGADEAELSDDFHRAMDEVGEDTLTLDRAEDVELDMDGAVEIGAVEDVEVEM